MRKIALALSCTIMWLLTIAIVSEDAPVSSAAPRAVTATGNSVYAASCSRADVQAAINQAQDGDVVRVPAGACTWNCPVNLSNTKGISLMCAAAGSCSITSTGTAVLFDTLSGINNRLYRISGFTFINTNGNFIIWMAGDGTLGQIRIDHKTFNTGADSLAVFFGHTQAIANYYGVIDHNVMTSAGSSAFQQIIGDTNPNPPASQSGPANNMFVEDNTITIQTMTNAVAAGGTLTAALASTPPANAITTTLRYSSALITDANWAGATMLTATLLGSATSYTATVPYSDETMFFALKTQDTTGTYSPLSNNAFWPSWQTHLPLVRK